MVVGEKCPVTIKCGMGLLSQLLAFDPWGDFQPKWAFFFVPCLHCLKVYL